MIVDEIQKHIPEGKILFGQNGSDPRNYKVDFSKVKRVLDFEPEYTVQYGIEELISAVKIGLCKDTLDKKNKYGNYVIGYEKH